MEFETGALVSWAAEVPISTAKIVTAIPGLAVSPDAAIRVGRGGDVGRALRDRSDARPRVGHASHRAARR